MLRKYLLVTVRAWIDVGLLRTDSAPGHDGVGVRVGELAWNEDK